MSIGELYSRAEQDWIKQLAELRARVTRRSQDHHLTERQREICRACIEQLDLFVREVGVL